MSQLKGQLHIAFIRKVAEHIHAQNDFKIPFEVCIRTALERHRQRLITIEKEMALADPYYGRNRAQKRFKDTVKIPIPPRIPYRGIPAPIPMSPLND